MWIREDQATGGSYRGRATIVQTTYKKIQAIQEAPFSGWGCVSIGRHGDAVGGNRVVTAWSRFGPKLAEKRWPRDQKKVASCIACIFLYVSFGSHHAMAEWKFKYCV